MRGLLVAAEAHAREVGLDEAGVDDRDPDRPAEQVFAQRVGEASNGVLRGDVERRVRVRLPPRDRADVHDVTALVQVRQREPGDPDEPVHVRLEDGPLVLLAALVEGIAAERETRRVDEHVDAAAELLDGTLDEALAARRIGHVELDRGVGVDPLGTACAAGYPRSFRPERRDGRRADAARGAGDDRGLAFERSHARGA